MKIRNGFVSNSSSSSFCVVGTDDRGIVRKTIRSLGYDLDAESPWNELSYGYGRYDIGKNTTFSWYGCGDLPYVVGIDANLALENNSLSEARVLVAAMFKTEFNIDIWPEQIDLHYGEMGN